MFKGDISNVVQPRILLVFEGSLGFISGPRVEAFNELARTCLWDQAWEQWTINEVMARKIWDVVKRQGMNVDLVTLVVPGKYRDEAARSLQVLMDARRLPIGQCLARSPEELSRELSYMPDVARVYDANPETAYMYGHKGVLLQNINDLGRF